MFTFIFLSTAHAAPASDEDRLLASETRRPLISLDVSSEMTEDRRLASSVSTPKCPDQMMKVCCRNGKEGKWNFFMKKFVLMSPEQLQTECSNKKKKLRACTMQDLANNGIVKSATDATLKKNWWANRLANTFKGMKWKAKLAKASEVKIFHDGCGTWGPTEKGVKLVEQKCSAQTCGKERLPNEIECVLGTANCLAANDPTLAEKKASMTNVCPACKEDSATVGKWSSWDNCSASCGNGTQSRSRTCSGLGSCNESTTDSQSCNDGACHPSCPNRDCDWKDSLGDGCDDYETYTLCKNGSPNRLSIAEIQLYAKNGFDAIETCAICGWTKPAKCPELRFKNGNLLAQDLSRHTIFTDTGNADYDHDEYDVKQITKALITCDSGYEIAATDISCESTGQWEYFLPDGDWSKNSEWLEVNAESGLCQPTTCAEQAVAHGTLNAVTDTTVYDSSNISTVLNCTNGAIVSEVQCVHKGTDYKWQLTDGSTLITKGMVGICNPNTSPDTDTDVFTDNNTPDTDDSPSPDKNNMRLLVIVAHTNQSRWDNKMGKSTIKEMQDKHMPNLRRLMLADSWGTIRLQWQVYNRVVDMGEHFNSLSRSSQQQMLNNAKVPHTLDHYDLWHMMIPNDGSRVGGRSWLNHRGSWGDCMFNTGGQRLNSRCDGLVMHELYHSLGLKHASGYDSSWSKVLEYGNAIDIMGNSGMLRIGLPTRYKLGWAPRNQINIVTDLVKEHTFKFTSFESKTPNMIGVMIPLNCTTVFVSRDNKDNFLVEYLMEEDSSTSFAVSTHLASQHKSIKVGDRYYDPMADMTIERTTQGARLYPGRQKETHEDKSLVEDVSRTRSDLKTKFEKGCGAVPKPNNSCTGNAPGKVVPGMHVGTGVALTRDSERLGTQRYECRNGSWIWESGLPIQYCRNLKLIPGNKERCP